MMTYILTALLLAFWTAGWVYFLHLTRDRKPMLIMMGGYWIPAILIWFAWPKAVYDYVKYTELELQTQKESLAQAWAWRLEAEERIRDLENPPKPKQELALVPKDEY